MAQQYLVLQNSALKAQSEIAKRTLGYEMYNEEEGTYYNPWSTKQPFAVIQHPTTNFSAIVIPDNFPGGMIGAEEWARGEEREYEGETIKGKPSQQETVDRLYPTNRPLKDHQYMVDNGWFPEEEIV